MYTIVWKPTTFSIRQEMVPFPFPFNDLAMELASCACSVLFCYGQCERVFRVFIDYAKQFFYSQRLKTCTMPQLIKKEGMTVSEAKLGHLMMQQGRDEARRPGGCTQTQFRTQTHHHSL